MANIVPFLLHPAQSSFVKTRSATLNIRKVLMVLEYPKSNPDKDLAIITLDAEKAFDNVSFDWLSMVLMDMGFSGPFKHLIESMYASPTARLMVTGLLTD